MRASEFLSNFLKGDDFPRPRELTIESVTREEVGQNKDQKMVLYFEEVSKGLVLGAKCNIETCIDVFGTDDTNQWSGQEIAIWFNPKVMFGTKRTGGLRLFDPVKLRKDKPDPEAEKARSGSEPIADEEVPF